MDLAGLADTHIVIALFILRAHINVQLFNHCLILRFFITFSAGAVRGLTFFRFFSFNLLRISDMYDSRRLLQAIPSQIFRLNICQAGKCHPCYCGIQGTDRLIFRRIPLTGII